MALHIVFYINKYIFTNLLLQPVCRSFQIWACWPYFSTAICRPSLGFHSLHSHIPTLPDSHSVTLSLSSFILLSKPLLYPAHNEPQRFTAIPHSAASSWSYSDLTGGCLAFLFFFLQPLLFTLDTHGLIAIGRYSTWSCIRKKYYPMWLPTQLSILGSMTQKY